jgi:hypothetical protein
MELAMMGLLGIMGMMGYLGTGERRNYALGLRQRGLAEGLVGIDGSDCGD